MSSVEASSVPGEDIIADVPDQDGSSDPIKDSKIDLVGEPGPFAVIESDPDVFTSLLRKLGVLRHEVIDIPDLFSPQSLLSLSHRRPKGLIFCYLWKRERFPPYSFDDPDAERVWFAEQLVDDACASLAMLNLVFNAPGMEIGGELEEFRSFTKEMSSKMKGLAVSNSPLIRRAHNSLARPADIREVLHTLAEATEEASKTAAKEAKASAAATSKAKGKAKASSSSDPTTNSKPAKPPPKKKKKSAKEDEDDEANQLETYHFISYVPAFGRVWEIDGLKSMPLEVGPLPGPPKDINGKELRNGRGEGGRESEGEREEREYREWVGVVQPALRHKMRAYASLQYSLLAVVEDRYCEVSDELELRKREAAKVKGRLQEELGEEWAKDIDPTLLEQAPDILKTSIQPAEPGPTFTSSFGHRKMQQDLQILELPLRALPKRFEDAVRGAGRIKEGGSSITGLTFEGGFQEGFQDGSGVEEELMRGRDAEMNHLKRTWDYEPFVREAVGALCGEGLLEHLLVGDEEPPSTKGKGKSNGNGSSKGGGKANGKMEGVQEEEEWEMDWEDGDGDGGKEEGDGEYKPGRR